MFDSGLYIFVMRLHEPVDLQVGRLGAFHFPAGWYLYTGSARRNLRKRVERHWTLKRKVRWHVDYLATAPGSDPVGAVVVPTESGLTECELNLRLGLMIGGSTPAPGFGASDCRAGCPAHLWYSQAPVSLLAVARIDVAAAVLMPGADFWTPQLQTLADLDSGE